MEIEQSFLVVDNEKIAKDIYKMRLLGNTEAITNPGQFVNIRLEGKYLRRPISVCDWTDASLALIYKVVGQGTEQMSQMKRNETLNVLVGLGNGFDTAKCGDTPLLIGGGVGVPPMYGLCKRLLEQGKKPTVVMGFASAEDVFYLDEFKALGVPVHVATVDGTMGTKGFVTDCIAQNTVQYDSYCACGPEPMLKAVHQLCGDNGQLSFEERMGCGFGACMGCSCKTKYGNKRICKDGPVLMGGEIVW